VMNQMCTNGLKSLSNNKKEVVSKARKLFIFRQAQNDNELIINMSH